MPTETHKRPTLLDLPEGSHARPGSTPRQLGLVGEALHPVLGALGAWGPGGLGADRGVQARRPLRKERRS